MSKYELIVDTLNNNIEHGYISEEFAEEVNILAFNKYISESESKTSSKSSYTGNQKNIYGNTKPVKKTVTVSGTRTMVKNSNGIKTPVKVERIRIKGAPVKTKRTTKNGTSTVKQGKNSNYTANITNYYGDNHGNNEQRNSGVKNDTSNGTKNGIMQKYKNALTIGSAVAVGYAGKTLHDNVKKSVKNAKNNIFTKERDKFTSFVQSKYDAFCKLAEKYENSVPKKYAVDLADANDIMYNFYGKYIDRAEESKTLKELNLIVKNYNSEYSKVNDEYKSKIEKINNAIKSGK